MTAGTIWQIVGVTFAVLFLAADGVFLWRVWAARIDGTGAQK